MREADKLARLREAVERGRQDWGVTLEKLRTGELQFHEQGNACAITHIGVSGAFKTLYVHSIAGELLDVPALGAQLEAFGRAMECQAIETEARLGWEKLFRLNGEKQGYKKVAIKYRKDL